MRRECVVFGALTLSGCWKSDPAVLPVGRVDFAPKALPTITGWVVEEYDTSLTCPDGLPAPLYVVSPASSAGPLPAAVLLHSGPFDYVPAPPANDPIGGPHRQDPPRLSREWAIRRVFATLGMYDAQDPIEQPLGALPGALAEANVEIVIPGNCWGDWWHNAQDGAQNDFTTDRFYRNGRASAEYAWKVASNPSFAAAEGITLDVPIDGNHLYAVGLGEGGRGVGEIIASGVAVPSAAFIDSSIDDLHVVYAQPTLYESTITGLNRIFPGGEAETDAASVANLTDLPPTYYLYSSLDSQIPSGAHDAALARLDADPNALVYDAAVAKHVLTGADLDLSRGAVTFLLNEGP